MTDEPRQESQDPGVETIFNSSIGEDWGEAFEAEDFMAAPKVDGSSEFFLPDDLTAGLPPASSTPSASLAPAAASALKPSVNLANGLKTRFFALPLPRKIASIAAPIALGLALTLLLQKPPAPPTVQQPAAPPKAANTAQHAETQEHPPQPQPAPRQAESTPPPPPAEKPHAATTAKETEIRKKWRFPAIIVQAKTDNGQDATILSTDLALVLKLHPEVMPPTAKDAFIREMIFQFYTNQPADDLRRFALERGEMTRKLQDWIVKQWPGLPLDSVSVDRYQLL